jgi:hypothetical protein
MMKDKGVNSFASCGEGCLFEEPFNDFDAVRKSSSEIPEFLERVEAGKDHRSVCIMGCLVAEHHVERILRLICPKYKVLSDSHDFTFSMQINFLEALFFVPSWITRDLHVIRAVRNEFAHSLSLSSLDDLKPGLKERIKTSYERWGPSGNETMFERYKRVLNFCIIGCRSYEPNLEQWQATVRSKTFVHELGESSERRFFKQVETAAEQLGDD